MTTPQVASELFDTHCHLFEHGFEGRTGVLLRGRDRELAEYERFRVEYGVARSLVVGYDEDGYAGNSAYIAGLAASRPWLVPLTYRRPESLGAVAPGERIAVYVTDRDAAGPVAEAIGAWVAHGGAPAILSLNATPGALALIAPPLADLDTTWCLVSHLGLPGPVASAAEAQERLAPLWPLAGRDHVSVKLSGQYAASSLGYPHDDVRVLVDLLADRLGAAALVWGSDFSPCLDAITLEEAVECALPTGASAIERHDILYGNAARHLDRFAGGDR